MNHEGAQAHVARDIRKQIQIQGVVQGVGFRPFIYRIAHRFAIGGWVLNSSHGAIIEAEGPPTAVEGFLTAMRRELPSLARIDEMTVTSINPQGENAFAIRESVVEPSHSHWFPLMSPRAPIVIANLPRRVTAATSTHSLTAPTAAHATRSFVMPLMTGG